MWNEKLEEFEKHIQDQLVIAERCAWRGEAQSQEGESEEEAKERIQQPVCEADQMKALQLNMTASQNPSFTSLPSSISSISSSSSLSSLSSLSSSVPPSLPLFSDIFYKARFLIHNKGEWFSKVPTTFLQLVKLFGLCHRTLLTTNEVSLQVAKNLEAVLKGSELCRGVSGVIEKSKQGTWAKLREGNGDKGRSGKSGRNGKLHVAIKALLHLLPFPSASPSSSPSPGEEREKQEEKQEKDQKDGEERESFFDSFLPQAKEIHFGWMEEFPEWCVKLFQNVDQLALPSAHRCAVRNLFWESDPLGLVLLLLTPSSQTKLFSLLDFWKDDPELLQYLFTEWSTVGLMFLSLCLKDFSSSSPHLAKSNFMQGVELLKSIEAQVLDPVGESQSETETKTQTETETEINRVDADSESLKLPPLSSLRWEECLGVFLACDAGLLEGHLWTHLHPLEIRVFKTLSRNFLQTLPLPEVPSSQDIQKEWGESNLNRIQADSEHQYWQRNILDARSRLWFYHWLSSPEVLRLPKAKVSEAKVSALSSLKDFGEVSRNCFLRQCHRDRLQEIELALKQKFVVAVESPNPKLPLAPRTEGRKGGGWRNAEQKEQKEKSTYRTGFVTRGKVKGKGKSFLQMESATKTKTKSSYGEKEITKERVKKWLANLGSSKDRQDVQSFQNQNQPSSSSATYYSYGTVWIVVTLALDSIVLLLFLVAIRFLSVKTEYLKVSVPATQKPPRGAEYFKVE